MPHLVCRERLADLGDDGRTLFAGKRGLEQAKQAIIAYKTGQTKEMTPQLWQAKKIVDSTLHPGTASLPADGSCDHGLTSWLLQIPANQFFSLSACPASSSPTWS